MSTEKKMVEMTEDDAKQFESYRLLVTELKKEVEMWFAVTRKMRGLHSYSNNELLEFNKAQADLLDSVINSFRFTIEGFKL